MPNALFCPAGSQGKTQMLQNSINLSHPDKIGLKKSFHSEIALSPTIQPYYAFVIPNPQNTTFNFAVLIAQPPHYHTLIHCTYKNGCEFSSVSYTHYRKNLLCEGGKVFHIFTEGEINFFRQRLTLKYPHFNN